MRRFAPKRTHALQYDTPVTTTPQQASDRTEDAILNVRYTARTDVKNRVVLLNPLACASTYYIFLNARQKHLMLCLDGDDYLG